MLRLRFVGEGISHELVREISHAARVDRRTAAKYLRSKARLYPSKVMALESTLQAQGLDHLLRRHARPEARAEAPPRGGDRL